MNQHNVVAKLNQIVEQAQLTLEDPRSLTTERQKMIIALARFICAEVSHASPAPRHLTNVLPDA
jgi:predicted outer membrane protein